MPCSIAPIISPRVDPAGSGFKLVMRSIGGRFQLDALELATPAIPERAYDTLPPRARSKMPWRMLHSRVVGCPQQLERIGGDRLWSLMKAGLLEHLEAALTAVGKPAEGTGLGFRALVGTRRQHRREIGEALIDPPAVRAHQHGLLLDVPQS